MDIKDEYKNEAERIANEVHGLEFEDLSEEQQGIVYNQAMSNVHDRLAGQADALIDTQRGV